MITDLTLQLGSIMPILFVSLSASGSNRSVCYIEVMFEQLVLMVFLTWWINILMEMRDM